MPRPPVQRPEGITDVAVVEAAMTDLTSWVYQTRLTSHLRWRVLTHSHLDDPRGGGRAGTVQVFLHLKHFRVTWDTDQVCDWARRRGWAQKDLTHLREFSDGVRGSIRFHTGPRPFHHVFVESWLLGRPLGDTRKNRAPIRIKSCCRSSFVARDLHSAAPYRAILVRTGEAIEDRE